MPQHAVRMWQRRLVANDANSRNWYEMDCKHLQLHDGQSRLSNLNMASLPGHKKAQSFLAADVTGQAIRQSHPPTASTS